MGDNRIRIVFIVEELNKKGIIPCAAFNRARYTPENFLCGVHKYFIQVFVLSDLVEKRAQRFDPYQLAMYLHGIA